MGRFRFGFSQAFFGLVVIICSAAMAFAQFKAGIQGTVTDTSGAGVGGATVTVTSQETAKSQTVNTDLGGFYRVSGLAPGQYTVTASFAGFKVQVVKDVAVGAEEVQGVNLVVHPGDVKETVTVTAEATPKLQTENGEVSGNITNQEVHALPQVGRDPYELARLAPGVFGDGSRSGSGNAVLLGNLPGSPGGSSTSIFQTENQVQISSNGQRVTDNNFEIDGVSVNSLGYGGAAVVTPSQESVKEIKVTSNAFDAQYGRSSGAQIEVVSQNGTNRFHGSGFFKYDQPGLNAFNKFGTSSGGSPARVENKFRNFGGSLGGPIVKEKAFFFFAYEGLRNFSLGTSNPTYIETPQYIQAVIAARPNGVTSKIFQMPGLQPRVVQVLTPSCSSFAPGNCQVVGGALDIGSITGAQGVYVNPNVKKDANNPNADPNGDFTGGGLDGVPDLQLVTLATPNTGRGHQYNARVDLQHGSNDSFAVGTFITMLRTLGSDAGVDSRPIGDIPFKPLNTTVTAEWNRILTPTMLNQVRANLTRFVDNGVADATQTNFGVPEVDVEGLPFSRIKFGANRSETTPALFAQNTIEFRDTLSKVFGNHGAKFGIEIRKEQDNSSLLGGARPVYSFSGLWNLANDTPIFEGINTDPRTGAPANAQKYFRTSNWGLFVQDDWKMRHNLTLNFGLRWEYYSPLTEHRGKLSNLIFPAPGDLKDATVQLVSPLYHSDYANFAPRLGFAYSPAMFSNKLVVRGGVGLFTNRIPNNGLGNVRGNPPFFARNNICCGTATTWFSTPFAGGVIQYNTGSSKSPTSFPINPNLAFGIDPKTGGVCGNAKCTSDSQVEIYGAQPNMEVPYVYEYSFGFEYNVLSNWVAAAGYEGSAGHKFSRIVRQDFLYTPNPNFGAIYFPMDDVNSNFNALNTRLTYRFSHGFQTQIQYRWSKSIDELSYGDSPCSCGNQTYPQNLKSERGPSDFDATHSLTASGLWELPFLRGRNDMVGKMAGGWQISGIMTAHSGFPWTPVSGVSVSTPGGPTLSPTRPIAQLANPGSDHSNGAFIRPGGTFPGGGAKYFDFTKSGPPGIGRNSFRGPHYFATDLSLAKQFRLGSYAHLGETAKIDVRANAFNVFNQLNLQPFLFDSNATHVDRPTFGQADSGLAGRVIEFQARLSF